MGKFTTFLIGGAVGAAAALLLSPRTGAENRALVGEAVGNNCKVPAGVQAKAGQMVDAAASTSTKVINAVVDNGSEAYKAVAQRAQQVTPPSVQAFSDNGDELREKIDAARERIATQVAKNAEAARDAAVDKIPAAIDAAQSAGAAAKGAAQSATEAAKGAAQSAGQAAADAAAGAKDAAASAASAVASKVSRSNEQ